MCRRRQRHKLRRAFPHVSIRSVSYLSTRLPLVHQHTINDLCCCCCCCPTSEMAVNDFDSFVKRVAMMLATCTNGPYRIKESSRVGRVHVLFSFTQFQRADTRQLHVEGIDDTSLPIGMELPSASVSPTTFATSVRKERYSFRMTPRMIVLISGIPDPVGSRTALLIISNDTGLHSIDMSVPICVPHVQMSSRTFSNKRPGAFIRKCTVPIACGDTK